MKTAFFHIPKTAGTFLANQYKNVLGYNIYKFFGNNNICEFLDRDILKLDKSVQLQKLTEIRSIKNASYKPCIDIDDLTINDKTFIYSHEVCDKLRHIFSNNQWHRVVVVRNPFERIFSCFAQRQRNNVSINLSETADNYQFYFTYLAFYNTSALPLTKQTADTILSKSIEILNVFDYIFDQNTIDMQFYNAFKKNTMPSSKIDNITSNDTVLNIPYKILKDSISFIEYDYEFYRTAIKTKFAAMGSH